MALFKSPGQYERQKQKQKANNNENPYKLLPQGDKYFSLRASWYLYNDLTTAWYKEIRKSDNSISILETDIQELLISYPFRAALYSAAHREGLS